jgi:hypothetical protein
MSQWKLSGSICRSVRNNMSLLASPHMPVRVYQPLTGVSLTLVSFIKMWIRLDNIDLTGTSHVAYTHVLARQK